jgi:hypothetical protein
MDRVASVYLEQITALAGTLEEVFEEVPPDMFNKRPGPHLNPIGWNCFHLLRVWDRYLNWECRGQSPREDAWHRGGFTEKSGYNPDGKGYGGFGIGFTYTDREVDEIQIRQSVLAEYLQMLMAETEAFLHDADEDELQRSVISPLYPDRPSRVGLRMQHIVSHSFEHVGSLLYAAGVLGWRDPSYPGTGD